MVFKFCLNELIEPNIDLLKANNFNSCRLGGYRSGQVKLLNLLTLTLVDSTICQLQILIQYTMYQRQLESVRRLTSDFCHLVSPWQKMHYSNWVHKSAISRAQIDYQKMRKSTIGKCPNRLLVDLFILSLQYY